MNGHVLSIEAKNAAIMLGFNPTHVVSDTGKCLWYAAKEQMQLLLLLLLLQMLPHSISQSVICTPGHYTKRWEKYQEELGEAVPRELPLDKMTPLTVQAPTFITGNVVEKHIYYSKPVPGNADLTAEPWLCILDLLF